MSDDRPRLISTPTSFSQGVARTDTRTWFVMLAILAIAIAAVLTLGLFHKKQPMFGNAPFGRAAPSRQVEPQPPQSQKLDAIPVVRAPPRPAKPH